MSLLLAAVLFMANGQELEISGDFMEAGNAYSEEADAPGQARILCEFLEESLYAGYSDHALRLILQLEMFGLSDEYYDMWFARLAWSCGLSEYACSQLELVEGSGWTTSRCRAMADLYRGNSMEAVQGFHSSYEQAESTRQAYYSLLDMGFALLQQGDFRGSEDIAVYLATRYPSHSLSQILLALSMNSQGRFGEGMSVLQNLYSSEVCSEIVRLYSRSLLEELE